MPLHRTSLFLLPILLCAAGLRNLSLEDLVAQSQVIVAGRVVRAWTGMDPEKKFIWTHYEIQVRATLKGPARPNVVVSEPGGMLEGRELRVPGSTPFAIGEEVGLFLYRTPIGYLRTTHYGEGKFSVSPDRRVHRNRATNLGGAALSPAAARASAGTSVETLEGLSWTEFHARVARIVSGEFRPQVIQR